MFHSGNTNTEYILYSIAFAYFERVTSAYCDDALFKELIHAIRDKKSDKFKLIGVAYEKCGFGSKLAKIEKFGQDRKNYLVTTILEDSKGSFQDVRITRHVLGFGKLCLEMPSNTRENEQEME